MSPKALLFLAVIAVTLVSALGLFLYGLLAGIRVALRFLMPLVLVLLVLMLIFSLLGGSGTPSRRG